MQHKLERSIRNTKRELIAAENGGLKDNFTAASVRLRRLRAYYEDFSGKAGLVTRSDLTQVPGYGRRLSGKALYAEKNAFTGGADGGIIRAYNRDKSERHSVSQMQIDNIIENELVNVKFTSYPKYNPRIRANGKTIAEVFPWGDVKSIAIQIGKQDSARREFLINTLLHEELEARIFARTTDHYRRLNNATNSDRHGYINAVIKRFFGLKGWHI